MQKLVQKADFSETFTRPDVLEDTQRACKCTYHRILCQLGLGAKIGHLPLIACAIVLLIWMAILLICLIALISITHYESISLVPATLKDLLQSRKGSPTKRKHMKQDLSGAI